MDEQKKTDYLRRQWILFATANIYMGGLSCNVKVVKKHSTTVNCVYFYYLHTAKECPGSI